MNEFWIITQASIPVFLVMGIGFVCRWLNCIPKDSSGPILQVVVNVLIPCMIVDSVMGNQALRDPHNLMLAPVLGISTLIIGLGVGCLATRLAGLSKRGLEPKKRSFIVSVGLYNYGYIPIPLALALYDQNTVGVLFVYNTAIEVCVWTIVVAILGGYSPLKEWRKIFNVPVVAIVVALILNAMRFDVYVPEVLGTTFHWLGLCAYPLGIMVTGGMAYDLCCEQNMMTEWRPTIVATVLRVLCLPIFFLFLFSFLPLSVELRRVLVLQSAMPTAIFAMVLSKLYHADPGTAFRIVMATTLLSFILTPIWIHIGSLMLGL